jgi:hypothetical protein
MALSQTAFTLFVWANVALVLAVFAYEVYAIATEHLTATR